MANSTLQTLIERMETEISAEITTSGTLSFLYGEPNGGIEVTDSLPDEERMRNYKRYRIYIYPDPDQGFEEIPRMGNRVKRIYRVNFSLFRKVPRKRKWIIFSEPDHQRAGVGMYEFANLVMDILRNNTLSGLVNLNGANQFTTPIIEDTNDPVVARIDFGYYCDNLQTAGSGGIQ